MLIFQTVFHMWKYRQTKILNITVYSTPDVYFAPMFFYNHGPTVFRKAPTVQALVGRRKKLYPLSMMDLTWQIFPEWAQDTVPRRCTSLQLLLHSLPRFFHTSNQMFPPLLWEEEVCMEQKKAHEEIWERIDEWMVKRKSYKMFLWIYRYRVHSKTFISLLYISLHPHFFFTPLPHLEGDARFLKIHRAFTKLLRDLRSVFEFSSG